MTVFKEVYEVVGKEALKLAREFAASRQVALTAQWNVVKKLGGVGFRPGAHGGIRTIFFEKKVGVPAGWRRVWNDGVRTECAPSRNTKAGIAINTTLSTAPKVKDWGKFADAFGWRGRMPMGSEGGRGIVYSAVGVHVMKPRERFFLRLPRELEDRWEMPTGLKLMRESDMIRAIEDHNASVKEKAAA